MEETLEDSRYLARLGVNVDHVAGLRQNRGTPYPDPVEAATAAENAGAHQITVHLREDRRHIQDRDLEILRHTVQTRLNLEMAATAAMIRIACRVKPDLVTIVPEKREELTTEGGLDVARFRRDLAPKIKTLIRAGIRVSLFIDPDHAQILASAGLDGVTGVELHTGEYANAKTPNEELAQYERIRDAAGLGEREGLKVYAGHGLHYRNTRPVAEISQIEELNIGHSIIARATFVGMERAVSEMLGLIRR